MGPIQSFDNPSNTLKSGFSLPLVGLGTYGMGGRRERGESGGISDDDSRSIIDKAIRSGITLIDMAEMYSGGHAETIVGEVIRDFSRDRLRLSSKVWLANLGYDDVLRACEGSLGRLGTDYLDLYLVHAPNDDIPLEDTVRALDSLVERGLVRAIGVSNFSADRLRRAQALAEHPIVVNQVHYNLAVQDAANNGVLELCQSNDVLCYAATPLERGELCTTSSEVVERYCHRYSCTPGQLALAWLIGQENVGTVFTPFNIEELQEDLGCARISLDCHEIDELAQEFPRELLRPLRNEMS